MPGSIGPAPFAIFQIENPAGGPLLVDTKTCLLPMVTPSVWYTFRLYDHYKNGVLIYAGGIMDQPYRYLEAMELIDEAVNRGE